MKSLKLNQLDSQRLAEKEMKHISGGEGTPSYFYRHDPACNCNILVCACGCQYSNAGGSSNADNGNANYKSGIVPANLSGGLK